MSIFCHHEVVLVADGSAVQASQSKSRFLVAGRLVGANRSSE